MQFAAQNGYAVKQGGIAAAKSRTETCIILIRKLLNFTVEKSSLGVAATAGFL